MRSMSSDVLKGRNCLSKGPLSRRKKEEMENDLLRNSENAFIGCHDENHRRSAHNGPAVNHNLASLFNLEKLLCRAPGSRPSCQIQLVFKFKMSNMEIGR